jgi:glycosyltransferase involved in cell wall biosynthesis
MKTVDVVIPVRDGARYLPACLDSVLAQTHPIDSIIVVDDGSRDETPAIIAAYTKRCANVRMIRSEPRGPSHARNLGIQACTAEFVALLDSDDTWMPEKIARQVALFDAAPAEVGFVHCDYVAIDESGRPVDGGPRRSPEKRGEVFLDVLDGYPISGSASAVVVRRELLRRVGGFDETIDWGEDLDLWVRLARVSWLDYVPEALTAVRVHASSRQRRRDRTRAKSTVLGKIRILEKWLDCVAGNERLIKSYRMEALHVGGGQLVAWPDFRFYQIMRNQAPGLTAMMFANAGDYRRGVAWSVVDDFKSLLSMRVIRRSRYLLWIFHRLGKFKGITVDCR